MPAGVLEDRIVTPISFYVSGQFGCPVPLVALWLMPMYGARMPEARINEHGDSATGEDDIGANPPTREIQLIILAEPEPHGV